MTSFVWFVGSGPGDPELLTLKAVSRLQPADAVLFDDLSSAVLGHARAGAQLVAVGKRAGHPSPSQANVSQLLVEYARTGIRVVRLNSGSGRAVAGRVLQQARADPLRPAHGSRMIDLHLIGVVNGNPDHLKRAAIAAMNAADLMLLPRTGDAKSDRIDLRRTICADVLTGSARVVEFDLPDATPMRPITMPSTAGTTPSRPPGPNRSASIS